MTDLIEGKLYRCKTTRRFARLTNNDAVMTGSNLLSVKEGDPAVTFRDENGVTYISPKAEFAEIYELAEF